MLCIYVLFATMSCIYICLCWNKYHVLFCSVMEVKYISSYGNVIIVLLVSTVVSWLFAGWKYLINEHRILSNRSQNVLIKTLLDRCVFILKFNYISWLESNTVLNAIEQGAIQNRPVCLLLLVFSLNVCYNSNTATRV